jgi:perosamine synthetase
MTEPLEKVHASRQPSSAIEQRIAAISVTPNATIRRAMQAIDAGALGLALIVNPDDGRFLGLVSDGDVRRALLSGMGLEACVWDVPRPEPKTAPLGAPLTEVAASFSDPVRVVPLLDTNGVPRDLAVMDRRMRLPVAEPSLGARELEYVSECILTGWISSAGRFVARFEEQFAAFCQTPYAVATSNGTTALHLALDALGIGPGDEVIVPTLTFIATANAVRYVGARPVFVDSDADTWNLDPRLVEAAVTPRTKAIIPVHLYGHPADMDPICDIARRHGFPVVEDAAEAHGAKYKGRPVGQLGDVAVFSFYGNKIVTTGEGGMVTTSSKDIAERVRMLRDHGMSPQQRYWHPVLGYNYRLTNLQAAVGVAQMERVDAILADKLRIAQTYARGLARVRGIVLPPQAPWASNVYWLYSVIVDAQVYGRSRDELMAALRQDGIDTRPLFHPVHTQPIYRTGQHLPVAERLARDGLSLPSAVGLRQEDIQRVTDAIAAHAR